MRPPITLLTTLALFLSLGCQEKGTEGTGTSTYPRKPIKVVVPFSAGGGSDTFVRVIQKAIRDEGLVPHPLVIINVPGAGGTVGSRRVRNGTADGHTILCLHEGILSSKYAGTVPYGPEAFRCIAATGESHLVVCVREDSEFGNLADLLESARANPDHIRFGMAPGTPTHFVGRRLESTSAQPAATFRYVASGGGANRFNDLVGGHLEVTPFSLAEYMKFRDSGVRAIALLGANRSPEVPDIPTAREQGIDVTMQHVQYWWAAKSTPDEAIEGFANMLEAAMATPYVREKLAELKTRPLFLRGAALEAHLAEREADFQDVALVKLDGLPWLIPTILGSTLILTLLTFRESFPNRKPIRPSLWLPSVRWLALIGVYVLAMQKLSLSYAVATAAFIPAMGLAMGRRSWKATGQLAAIGLCLSLATWFVFTRVLVIDLP